MFRYINPVLISFIVILIGATILSQGLTLLSFIYSPAFKAHFFGSTDINDLLLNWGPLVIAVICYVVVGANQRRPIIYITFSSIGFIFILFFVINITALAVGFAMRMH